MSHAKEIIKHTDIYSFYQGPDALNVSELFTDTIQGEGIYVNHPAVFFRLKGCLHNCVFCDTRQIWKNGNRFSFDTLLAFFREYCYPKFHDDSAHLVVTGGSPLQQQKPLADFLRLLKKDYHDKTGYNLFIEIENEAAVVACDSLIEVIDCWNNSPKLKNSLVPRHIRYNVKALKQLNKLNNSWFKFVISRKLDWDEIVKEYLPFIDIGKVLLMPMGTTNEELDKNIEIIRSLVSDYEVSICDREHIRQNKK